MLSEQWLHVSTGFSLLVALAGGMHNKIDVNRGRVCQPLKNGAETEWIWLRASKQLPLKARQLELECQRPMEFTQLIGRTGLSMLQPA